MYDSFSFKEFLPLLWKSKAIIKTLLNWSWWTTIWNHSALWLSQKCFPNSCMETIKKGLRVGEKYNQQHPCVFLYICIIATVHNFCFRSSSTMVALLYSRTLQSVKIESVKNFFCLKLPNSSRKSIKNFNTFNFTLCKVRG